MPEGILAVRMSKKYAPFLPQGAKIINYAEKATGRDCDICGHTPEVRPPKPGYPHVSEEMRLMRVKLAPGTDKDSVTVGNLNFTVTGDLIEINCCADTANCRRRASEMTNEDGSPRYESVLLQRFR